MFKRKPKEINSDLFYKVKLESGLPFSYERNGGSIKENKTKLNLRPGDWVTLNYKGKLIFEERKILNLIFSIIIKRRSFFSLLVQVIMLLSYAILYAFLLVQMIDDGNFEDAFARATFYYLLKDLILFIPLFMIMYKMGRTAYRSFSIIGPAKGLKNKFSEINSIKFYDVKNKFRTIQFDNDGKMLEDKKGNYLYRESQKITHGIYKFDLLVANKEEKELYKFEYYTVQIDFTQGEGVLMTNGKKLEYSKVEVIK